MKNFVTLMLLLTASLSYSKPLTFVTYHATSQYYPTMSANAIFNAVPYGGKLILKVEPEVNKLKAKKSLKANNLVAEGDVQFGGTTATKGTLSMHNVSGRAKALEAVDAHIHNLYLYGVKYPAPPQAMRWTELTLQNGYTATFLTAGFIAPPVQCQYYADPEDNDASPLTGMAPDTADGNVNVRINLSSLAQPTNKGKTFYDVYPTGEQVPVGPGEYKAKNTEYITGTDCVPPSCYGYGDCEDTAYITAREKADSSPAGFSVNVFSYTNYNGHDRPYLSDGPLIEALFRDDGGHGDCSPGSIMNSYVGIYDEEQEAATHGFQCHWAVYKVYMVCEAEFVPGYRRGRIDCN